MRKVALNMNEQYKYEVIKDCCDGKLSNKFCEAKLNITRRAFTIINFCKHVHFTWLCDACTKISFSLSKLHS